MASLKEESGISDSLHSFLFYSLFSFLLLGKIKAPMLVLPAIYSHLLGRSEKPRLGNLNYIVISLQLGLNS